MPRRTTTIPRRPGLTLIEVVVSVALVAILTGITIPAVRGQLRDASANAVVNEFTTLEAGLRAYRQDIGRMPPDLSYLYTLPPATASVPADWCVPGRKLPTALVQKWHGPYINRAVNGDYSLVQNDTVESTLTWTTITVGTKVDTVGVLQIRSVDTATAGLIDIKIDGLVDATSGRLRWTNVPLPRISYYFPINASDAC